MCTFVPKTERYEKYSLMLIIAAALLLEAMGAAQFFLARRSTQEELLGKAQRDLVQSKRVAGVKAEVESAVRNIHDAVEKSIDDPDHYYVIATQMVKNNPEKLFYKGSICLGRASMSECRACIFWHSGSVCG